MKRPEFIQAQTSGQAVDFAGREVAKLAWALITMSAIECKAKLAHEEASPNFAAIAEANAEFFTQIAFAVIDVLAKYCPDADFVDYLHQHLASPERFH